MTRVLLTHAYSTENAGDGLLVEETLSIIKQVLPDSRVDLFASHPDGFVGNHQLHTVTETFPSLRLLRGDYIAKLRRLREYDLIVAVGGGYLRFGTPVEAAKTTLVHLPQLVAGSRAGVPVVYMPQSIGPLRFGTRVVLRRLLSRVTAVLARDDRTASELDLENVRRLPDLALSSGFSRVKLNSGPTERVVVGTRSLRPDGAARMAQLGRELGVIDGFVQSTVRSNNDVAAVAALAPRETYSIHELTEAPDRRVVVSVRLHGALMALRAGHTVIHLSYERKGFGAFQDLNLGPYVHSVYKFDPAAVADQAQELLRDGAAREAYDSRIESRSAELAHARDQLEAVVRAALS